MLDCSAAVRGESGCCGQEAQAKGLSAATQAAATASQSDAPQDTSSKPIAANQMEITLQALLGDDKDVTKADVRGKRVLLRADLNVPLSLGNDSTAAKVADDNRIVQAVPTIKLLSEKGARVVIASHLGRPDLGKRPDDRKDLSLQPVADVLATMFPSFVGLAPDCIGPEVEAMVSHLQDGQILLLENTRFHNADTANSEEFAASLVRLGDVFVNDAFGVVHRKQASVTGVAEQMPVRYPGLLVRKEITALGKHLSYPERPFGVVMGGSKVADKLGIIDTMIDKADMVLIGGKMALTFLAAIGVELHESQFEADMFEQCHAMMAKAKERGVQLLLPIDVLVGDSLEETAKTHLSDLNLTCCTKEKPCVPCCMYGADIGPKTMELFGNALKTCRTIFWNGPVGKFEVEIFSKGTTSISEALREATAERACITVVGGGDSANALRSIGYMDEVTHVSTGGGAALEFIEGRSMPGLEALV